MVTVAVVLAAIVALVVLAAWPRFEDREVAVDELRVLDDERTIQAVVVTNSCGDPQRLDVTESPTRVGVVAIARVRINGDCDDVAIAHTLHATLNQPLGDRALIAERPQE